MTNSIIPYSFAPGTKAKAQEVNANFNALAEKIEENNSTAIHEDSDATINGNLTFSKQINSTAKCHDTSGNLTILNLADGETCFAVLAKSDKSTNSGVLRITNETNYNEIAISAFNENGSERCSIGIRNTNGVAYAYAPTYTSNYADSSDRIVTTAFMANHWATSAAGTTSTASKTRPVVVTQNYKNGNSWYRVFSDGWIEQGGIINASNTQVTFIKKFASKVYYANRCNINTHTGVEHQRQEDSVSSVTLSGMKVVTNQYTGNSYWYACGY